LSELNWVSGTVAAGSEANGSLEVEFEFEPEPQPTTKTMIAVSPRHKAVRRKVTGESHATHIRE
jgi:hypothetical protein